jgi:DNA invertase Pin-like site-specific DNA recombinase
MPLHQCDICKRWFAKVHSCTVGGEMRCKQCQLNDKHTHSQKQQHQHQQQQLEFLSHRDTDTQRMNTRQRDAIITLYQNGDSAEAISMKVGCAKSTVYYWLKKYDATGELNDDLREGN